MIFALDKTFLLPIHVRTWEKSWFNWFCLSPRVPFSNAGIIAAGEQDVGIFPDHIQYPGTASPRVPHQNRFASAEDGESFLFVYFCFYIIHTNVKQLTKPFDVEYLQWWDRIVSRWTDREPRALEIRCQGPNSVEHMNRHLRHVGFTFVWLRPELKHRHFH